VRLVVLLVLLAAAPAAWCQAAGQDEERSALDVIGDCSDAADEETVGLTALEEECPGLTRALDQSAYLPLLSTTERDALDAYDLSDLLTLDDWYAEQDATARDPDVAALKPILDSLRAQEPQRALTWFERFKRWLRSIVDRQEQDSDNWLSRWLEKREVPEVVATTILFVGLALILALTILVILNELRAAGVFRKRLATEAEGMATSAAAHADDGAVDLDSLPADRKASMLLRMLVKTLVQSGRLRTERSLTHRELGVRARFDDPQQRESFERVAELAERVVYGHANLSREDLDSIVQAGRALNSSLNDKLSGAPA